MLTWANPVLMDFIGFLGVFFFIFATCLFVCNVLSEFIPKSSQWSRYEKKVDEWKNRWTKRIKGMAQSWAAVMLFSVACLGMISVMVVRSQWPTVTEHNLRIESHPTDRQWWIVDDEHPEGFMYYACYWPGNEDYIKAGYFAKKATWEVQKDCNSIREQGLEFDYVWKADGTAKTIKEMGYE